MKKIIFLSIVVCCLAAITFMSCNTGDSTSWTPLTPTQKAACFSQTMGVYNGKMVYYNTSKSTNSTNVTDTVNVSWTVGSGVGADSTVTINNFPVKVLAQYISDKSISTALAAYSGTVSLNSPIYFYQTSPVPAFLMKPETLKCKINYDDADHIISLYFYQSTLYSITSYGYYSSSQKTFKMGVSFGGYKIDAKDGDASNVKTPEFTINGRTYLYAPLDFTATR